MSNLVRSHLRWGQTLVSQQRLFGQFAIRQRPPFLPFLYPYRRILSSVHVTRSFTTYSTVCNINKGTPDESEHACADCHNDKVKVGAVESQMRISFTCKVCETRSTRSMSKVAYAEGVVVIRCPGCDNMHLIADNLGWFDEDKRNIEDILAARGEVVKRTTDGNSFEVI